MYTVTISDIIQVSNRRMTSVLSSIGSQAISTGVSLNLYAVVIPPAATAVVVDINRMIRATPNVDFTQSYNTFIVNTLTSNLVLENFVVSFIPRKDVQTKKYLNRVDVYDAIAREDFTVSYGNSASPDDLDDAYARDRSNDLCLTYSGSTQPTFSNFLVAVNGVFHATMAGASSLWVTDGYENVRQSKKMDVLAVDTTAIGGHTCIPIVSSMVTSSSTTIDNEVTLTMPTGTSLLGKTVLVIIDGYIQVVNGTYKVVNDHTIKLYTNLIDIFGNYLNSPNQRFTKDLYGVPNYPNPYNPSQLVSTEYPAGSDANDPWLGAFTTARALPMSTFDNAAFTLSRITGNHSFVVVLNNADIFVEEFPLMTYGQTKIYENMGSETPRGFFMYGRGKAIPYTLIQAKDGQHTLFTANAESTEDLYKTAPSPQWVASAMADGYNPLSDKRSYMIDLFSA